MKNCNYCEHLNLTEEQQHKAGTVKPHICLKYGKNESLSESDGKGAIYGKI